MYPAKYPSNEGEDKAKNKHPMMNSMLPMIPVFLGPNLSKNIPPGKEETLFIVEATVKSRTNLKSCASHVSSFGLHLSEYTPLEISTGRSAASPNMTPDIVLHIKTPKKIIAYAFGLDGFEILRMSGFSSYS